MPLFRRLLIAAAGLCTVLCTATPAAAQIYSWRDADGKLILSDKPRPDQGQQTTYEVHQSAAIRATIPQVSRDRSAPYDASINAHSERLGVAADLVRAVIQVES